jgi:type II secretory pathway pseudopilin PulG
MITARATDLSSCLRSSRCRAGFTVLELVVMIALIGVLAAMAANYMGGTSDASRVTKLQSDVATLNQMVSLYVMDGGSVAGLTAPQDVLDKMKRTRPQAEWQQHTGHDSGRLVDVRLRARMTSQPESANTPRVTWDRTKQRFILGAATGNAVSEFYLDGTLAGANFGTETRTKSLMAFNASSSGWVWGTSVTNAAANYLNPQSLLPPNPASGFDPNAAAPASSTPPPYSGGGSGGGDPSGDGVPAQPTKALLPIPTITPAGGTFAFGSFPTSVTLDSNGAQPNVSTLTYSVNGGGWQAYGGPIPLYPAMNVQARNESTKPAEYATSAINYQTYYRLTSGFSGTDVGSWGNALGGANLVTSIQNGGATTTFVSGNTKLDLGNGQYLDAGVQNSLNFTPATIDSVTPNTWFDFGAMQILNGTTFYNSEATGVTLSVNLNLTQPAINFTAHVDLGLVSTTNTSDRLASADIVQLLNPTTDFAVTIDGVQYRMELQWVSLDPASSVVQGNNLLVYEGSTAAVELRARFTSNY